MPVNARRLIRKMRGGAQSHLVEADDDRFYVVKFQNNPQHRRILVNEFVSSVLLRYLRICCPEPAVVQISEDFLCNHPDVYIQLGTRRLDVCPGWHYGSRYPGDPDRIAVYDFIPDALLPKVTNLPDFLGILAFDKWMGNADSRQAVYFRARLRDWSFSPGAHPLKQGFVACMIDHGFVFNGPYWDFVDSPLQGLYFRPLVYADVTSWDDFQPWLDQIVHFPEEVIDQAYRQIPPQWIEGEEEAFERILERLMSRRKRVPELICDCRRGRVNPFPKWTAP